MNGPGLRQFFRQGVALTTGSLIQALTGLGAQIVLMRLLQPEDFGRFAITLAGCSLVQTFLSFRLNVLIIRLNDHPADEQLARLYQAALIWETVAATLVAMLWLAATDMLSGPALILLTALTLGQWVNQVVAFYERGMQYGRITLIETGSQLGGHVAAIILALVGAGALSLYLRELFAICCRLGAYGAIGALPRPVWCWPRVGAFRQVWHQTRAIWTEGLLEGLFSRLTILISGILTDLHGAGLFAQSHRLAMLPHQFLAPVMSRMAINLFSRTNNEQIRIQLGYRLLLTTIAVLGPGIVVIWLWAPVLVPWLFGDHWREAGTILRGMIGVIAFLSLFDLLRSFCYAQQWVLPVIWGRVVQIVTFTLPALLLPAPDAYSLAWTLSAAMAAGFVVITGLALWRLRAR